jgi:sigma-E factor negative regulatory protein RseA
MNERISALMDGEFDGVDAEGCLDGMRSDTAQCEAWAVYHLIGDTLRGQASAPLDRARFAADLDAEPTVLAPQRRAASTPKRRAAWYALSAAASVAAVAFVGWTALQTVQPGPQIAGTGESTLTAVAPSIVPVAQGVNDYLLAHQRFSPSSTMGMTSYIRTVAEDARAR